MKNFNERFLELQTRLEVSKSEINTFGNFNYRTKPQILEAIKPLARELKIIVYTTSELVELSGRIFVKSTAIAHDIEDETLRKEATAFAEIQHKSGTKMSEPQLTGSSDSYAGKYALGNLFNIDDNKDPDDDGTTITVKEVGNIVNTTVNVEKKESGELMSKIITTDIVAFTAEVANNFTKEANTLVEKEAVEKTLKMIKAKALGTKKLKYNEERKLWEEI